MKQQTTTLGLAAAFALTLTACGGSSDAELEIVEPKEKSRAELNDETGNHKGPYTAFLKVKIEDNIYSDNVYASLSAQNLLTNEACRRSAFNLSVRISEEVSGVCQDGAGGVIDAFSCAHWKKHYKTPSIDKYGCYAENLDSYEVR